MSKISNKTNLMAPLFEAVSHHEYTGRDSWRTASSLPMPPQKEFLKRKYDSEITEDVQDLYHRFFGEISHLVVERAAKRLKEGSQHKSWVSEERLHMEVLGKKISGQFDLYDLKTKTLYDIKTCSGWELSRKRPIKETWLGQMKVLTALLHEKGFEVKRTVIQRIVRDFSPATAMKSPDFAQVPFIDVEIETVSPKEALAYTMERVRLHLSYEKGEQIDCTAEERYARPDEYAVMRKGRKTAIRVFASEMDAKLYAQNEGSDCYIELRPADNKGCQLYCTANLWCPQFKKYAISKMEEAWKVNSNLRSLPLPKRS